MTFLPLKDYSHTCLFCQEDILPQTDHSGAFFLHDHKPNKIIISYSKHKSNDTYAIISTSYVLETKSNLYTLDFFESSIIIEVYSQSPIKFREGHTLDRSAHPFAHFDSPNDLLQFIQTILAFS